MDYARRFLEYVFPNTAYYVPAAILLFFIVALARAAIRTNSKSKRANCVLGVVISALLLMVIVVDMRYRWQWIVGFLPMLMVGYQLFFLWLHQPKEIDGVDHPTFSAADRKQSIERAQETISSHFGLKTLFIRYGLPAVLLGITGIVILDILVEPGKFFSLLGTDENVTKILLGIRLGAVGSYVYVLLELGRRTFHHDVTGASAMWCLVTLVLGPVLAATVAVLWRMEGPPSSGWWGGGVVLFFAGFAPRRVIAAIEQAAVQLLKIGPSTGVVESRLIPLTKIRGISPQIEERLGEEGVLDVHSLAAAEPIRLVRNTSFDLRQIISWIDEGMLIVTLPKSWETLEEEGITGAIDLAWYHEQLLYPDDDRPKKEIIDEIEKLAKKAKLEEASLFSTIRRLNEDQQVQYIWTLYNHFTEYAGATPIGNEPDDEDTARSDSADQNDDASEV
jgi:hypothetical protein